METTIVGKELVYVGDELNKSRVSLPVLDVVFQERIDGGFVAGWDVFAVTSRGREQIGAIFGSINWVGSRDLVVTDGGSSRLFVSVPSGPSTSEDKEAFVAQWKDTQIFVRPELPKDSEDGDRAFIGGDHILIETWMGQSRAWMNLATETSRRDNDQYLNIAFGMAGYAVELVFKSLAWIVGTDRRPIHRIGPFYQEFSGGLQGAVASVIENNGWGTANDFVEYVDDYLNPVHRRYFGISTDGRYMGLNILKDDKWMSLANTHHELCQLVDQFLVRRV